MTLCTRIAVGGWDSCRREVRGGRGETPALVSRDGYRTPSSSMSNTSMPVGTLGFGWLSP